MGMEGNRNSIIAGICGDCCALDQEFWVPDIWPPIESNTAVQLLSWRGRACITYARINRAGNPSSKIVILPPELNTAVMINRLTHAFTKDWLKDRLAFYFGWKLFHTSNWRDALGFSYGREQQRFQQATTETPLFASGLDFQTVSIPYWFVTTAAGLGAMIK